MNNQYFGNFLNNHTWKTLQGSQPLGRKYWETPSYTGKLKQDINGLITKQSLKTFATENKTTGQTFEMAPSKPQYYTMTKENNYPHSIYWFKKLISREEPYRKMAMTMYSAANLNNIEIYKKGMNTGWFPDYAGDFQNLKESGTTTPHNFDFSQTFKPGQMSANDENLFYNIQLGQNMRMQALQKYGGAHGNGFYHRAKSYYFAVTL